jgi:hypothetical protein
VHSSALFPLDVHDQTGNSGFLGWGQSRLPWATMRLRVTLTAPGTPPHDFVLHAAKGVVASAPHCAIIGRMNEVPCSTPGCPRRVRADSKIHRIVLHDPGTRVLGILYYCSPCLEHFASYGPYGHFAPRYGPTPPASQQSLAEWSAWIDQLLEEDT